MVTSISLVKLKKRRKIELLNYGHYQALNLFGYVTIYKTFNMYYLNKLHNSFNK